MESESIKYIKLVCAKKDKSFDGEIILNLKEDISNLWMDRIIEEDIYFRSFTKINRHKTFGFLSIRMNESADKQVPDKDMSAFDYLRTIQGIYFLDYLNENMELIERIMSPGIPGYDDQDMYTLTDYDDGSLRIIMKR